MDESEFKTKKFWAGVILYNSKKNQVLLNHRDNDAKVNPGMWSFFGGGNELGESPENCAVREIAEELSVKIDKDSMKLISYYLNHTGDGWHYIYLVDFDLDKSQMTLGEGQDFDWVQIDKAVDYNLTYSTRKDLQFFIENFRK